LELWDVLDKDGAKTGRTVVRGQELQSADFHLAVHVWIRNEHAAYLIQKRADHVESGPGIWATTVGHVWAGEDSLPAALRETREEIGLEVNATHLRKIHRLTTGQLIQDVYVMELPMDEVGSPTLGPEVSAIQWASKAEIKQMIRSGVFFAYSYFEAIVPD
jgi:isopentenyldiphosphate isomerase